MRTDCQQTYVARAFQAARKLIFSTCVHTCAIPVRRASLLSGSTKSALVYTRACDTGTSLKPSNEAGKRHKFSTSANTHAILIPCQCSVPFFCSGFGGLIGDRRFLKTGRPPPAGKPIQRVGLKVAHQLGPPIGLAFRPVGAAQTSKIDDFRSAPQTSNNIENGAEHRQDRSGEP